MPQEFYELFSPQELRRIRSRMEDEFEKYLLTEPVQRLMEPFSIRRDGVVYSYGILPILWHDYYRGFCTALYDIYDVLHTAQPQQDIRQALLQRLMLRLDAGVSDTLTQQIGRIVFGGPADDADTPAVSAEY